MLGGAGRGNAYQTRTEQAEEQAGGGRRGSKASDAQRGFEGLIGFKPVFTSADLPRQCLTQQRFGASPLARGGMTRMWLCRFHARALDTCAHAPSFSPILSYPILSYPIPPHPLLARATCSHPRPVLYKSSPPRSPPQDCSCRLAAKTPPPRRPDTHHRPDWPLLSRRAPAGPPTLALSPPAATPPQPARHVVSQAGTRH